MTVANYINALMDSFIIYRANQFYYQVAASVLGPDTFAREIAPLQKLSDHYPEFILSLDEISMEQDGIKQLNIIDFLLQK